MCPFKIQEIKEAVELPLTHPELYEEIGIRPPKGVVLYGEPGESGRYEYWTQSYLNSPHLTCSDVVIVLFHFTLNTVL